MRSPTPEALFEPAGRSDPYPLYAELRELAGGVHPVPACDAHVVLRHADVRALTADGAPVSSDVSACPVSPGRHDPGDPIHRRYAVTTMRALPFTDPPRHGRLRAPVCRALDDAACAGRWPTLVEEVAADLLDAIPRGAELDVVEHVGEVLPGRVIAAMLGLPAAEHERVRDLTHTFVRTFDPTLPWGDRDQAIRLSVNLFDYVRGVAEVRGREPGDDLLSALMEAEDGGGQLAIDDVVAMVVMLLAAGHRTAGDMIASTLALLLDHPDQFDLVRAEPGRIPAAVREAVRVEPPVQFVRRRATEDIVLGDRVVPAGGLVLPCLAAANRDPRAWARPDAFDLTRDAGCVDLAFGAGPHACPASRFACLQAETVLRALLERFARIGYGSGPRAWRADDVFTRGLETLPVAVA